MSARYPLYFRKSLKRWLVQMSARYSTPYRYGTSFEHFSNVSALLHSLLQTSNSWHLRNLKRLTVYLWCMYGFRGFLKCQHATQFTSDKQQLTFENSSKDWPNIYSISMAFEDFFKVGSLINLLQTRNSWHLRILLYWERVNRYSAPVPAAWAAFPFRCKTVHHFLFVHVCTCMYIYHMYIYMYIYKQINA